MRAARQGSLGSTLLLCAFVGAPCFPTGTAANEGPSSIEQARVVFAARRGEARELYVLDRGTGRVERLTEVGGEDAGANAPRLSPDGDWIAFQVRIGSNYDVHVMPVDGGPSRNVSSHPDFDGLPQWSPDGRELAFMSTRGLEPSDAAPFPGHIYVVSVDGGEPRRVTREPLTSSLGPTDWSPDGKSLLLARPVAESLDVFVLDVATGEERRLTDSVRGEYSAVFANDGRRVAFHSETDSESQIEVMNLDGSGRRALTSGPGWRYYPRWSPDDRWILFTGSRNGDQYDLYAVDVESGVVVDLVVTPEDEREGEWLPARHSGE